MNERARKKFIKKEQVERGEAHYTNSGRIVPAKNFDPQTICQCKYECALHIDVLRQQQIFDHYYKSSNWTEKTVFIRSNVSRSEVKCRKSQKNPIVSMKARLYNTEYSLSDGIGIRHTVCRNFFLNLLQISGCRIRNALSSDHRNPNAVDRRGKNPCYTKTKTSDLQFMKEFIAKFPCYESHYCRSNTNKKYLDPSLNIARMYREYSIVCDFQKKKCLSEFAFRKMFNYDFNLAFKRRKLDTCKKCDELKIIQRTSDVTREIQHHEELVLKTKNIFLNDISLSAVSNEKVQCFTFDLQKTLETPSLSTNVAYYKRKLWTYNLCIYDEVHKTAFMYVWSEDVASRGSQEIGSALLYHFKHNTSSSANHIILYSDSCVGQNRNIKLTLMLKRFLCGQDQISKIEQKYFVSGHSYNSCDRSFGIIEKQKKVTENIFCPQHWANLIRQAKKNEPKFVVTEMSEKDFFSSERQQELIVRRRQAVNGEKVNWFTIRKIVHIAIDPFMIYIEVDDDNNKSIDISRGGVTVQNFKTSKVSQLPKPKITKKKYKDLMSLLKYIPNEFHAFYVQLSPDNDNVNDEDFGLASGCSDEDTDKE